MQKTYPDKYIRKAIFDLIDGIVVSGETINVYDTRVTGVYDPEHYILLTTQTNQVDKNNKCEWFWDSSILIDIVTTYPRPGNPGSRLLADDIAEEVRNQIVASGITLGGGLSVIHYTLNYPNDLFLETPNENVFRKLLRLELKIK